MGEQKLAGVTYNIYDFPTSPVPTCIMLAGPNVPGQLPAEIKGIPVNRKADAFFFLHTPAFISAATRRRRKRASSSRSCVT